MKPRTKNDSWYYPASKTPARRRVRRIAAKRRRRADREDLVAVRERLREECEGDEED